MTLPLWKFRAQEEAHLFNPAFCGALSYEFCKAYTKTSLVSGVDLPLVFCALPLSLHMGTRVTLPTRTVTSLYTWLERNPSVQVGFAKRAKNLTPYLKEGISFAASRNALAFSDDGQLTLGVGKASFTPKFSQETTNEVRDIVNSTRLLGRWFSGAGTSSTILSAWGITV